MKRCGKVSKFHFGFILRNYLRRLTALRLLHAFIQKFQSFIFTKKTDLSIILYIFTGMYVDLLIQVGKVETLKLSFTVEAFRLFLRETLMIF